jgi:hypothetical protein
MASILWMGEAGAAISWVRAEIALNPIPLE